MTAPSTLAPRARKRMQPPPPPDPITQYALDVVASRVVAGKYVRKACERHVADLANDRGLYFDAAAGTKAVRFFALLRHWQGDLGSVRTDDGKYGAFVHLEPWQVFIVGSAFGWKRQDGKRRFRRVYVEVGKKNGKTLMAAGFALLLAFFDDEPGAEVYSAATKEDQARLSWNDGARFVTKNDSLQRHIRQVGKRLVHEKSASFWTILGRDSDTGDQGINVHGAIIDEIHVLENQDTIDNIETATGARSQPMIVKITTAGVRGMSVWEGERRDAIAVVEGRATDDTMLVLIYTLDEGDDPFDEAVWPKANPNLDISVLSSFIREQADLAQRSPGKLARYLRYHMNIPTAVSTKAIDINLWDRWIDADGVVHRQDEYVVQPAPGSGCYGGLDLAYVLDLTALVLLFQAEDGLYDALCWFWCPEEGVQRRSKADGVPYADWVRDGYMIATPGDVTDYEFVKATILEQAQAYTLGEIGFDSFNAIQMSVELGHEGVRMLVIPQTWAGLAPGWRELEKLVLEGKLRHGGHPVLRWMAGNVEVETDAAGHQRPSKAHSSERIDGMVALDMALGRWMANGAPAIWTAA